MSDREELQAALAWASLPQVGEQTLLALMDHSRLARQSLAQLWRSRSDDLAQLVNLHPRALSALQEHSEAVWAQSAVDLDEAAARGAELLMALQPDFPQCLGSHGGHGARRWPFVFAFGALGLLEEPRIALVNSRDVSPAALGVTDALADALARRDFCLVTSTNREAYQACATAAKRQAGPTILVLDRGIQAALPGGLHREPVATARVWDEAFDPELQLLLSPFGWREHWTARNGKRRDSLIFDLADVVIAIDVRAGGHIQQECRRAAESGRPVIVLDRGKESPEGTRQLCEGCPEVRGATWCGGEGLANEIARLLPSPALEPASLRHSRGWLREIGLFLCRLASTWTQPPLFVSTYPESGVFAAVAQLWSSSAADRTRGSGALLADFWSSANPRPSQVQPLLARVAPGGILALLVPAGWLTHPEFAGERAEWLRGAALRLTVGIPAPSGTMISMQEAAVMVLQRSPAAAVQTQSFIPDQSVGGRFLLRRYLREVISAVNTASPAPETGRF